MATNTKLIVLSAGLGGVVLLLVGYLFGLQSDLGRGGHAEQETPPQRLEESRTAPVRPYRSEGLDALRPRDTATPERSLTYRESYDEEQKTKRRDYSDGHVEFQTIGGSLVVAAGGRPGEWLKEADYFDLGRRMAAEAVRQAEEQNRISVEKQIDCLRQPCVCTDRGCR